MTVCVTNRVGKVQLSVSVTSGGSEVNRQIGGNGEVCQGILERHLHISRVMRYRLSAAYWCGSHTHDSLRRTCIVKSHPHIPIAHSITEIFQASG